MEDAFYCHPDDLAKYGGIGTYTPYPIVPHPYIRRDTLLGTGRAAEWCKWFKSGHIEQAAEGRRMGLRFRFAETIDAINRLTTPSGRGTKRA